MIWTAFFGGQKRKEMVWTHLRISSPAVCRQMCSSCTCLWEYAKRTHSSTPVYVDTSWLLKLQIWYQNNPFCANQVFAKLHTVHLWKSHSESLAVCTSPIEQAAELWPLFDSERIQKLPVWGSSVLFPILQLSLSKSSSHISGEVKMIVMLTIMH